MSKYLHFIAFIFIVHVLPIEGQRNCYVQTCNQLITGRQFRYRRALRVIQNEEYLDEADLDFLRRRRRVKRFLNFGGASLDTVCGWFTTLGETQFATTYISPQCTAYGVYPVTDTIFFDGSSVTFTSSTECVNFGINYFRTNCSKAAENNQEEVVEIENEVEDNVMEQVAVGVGIAGGAMLVSFPNFPIVNEGLVPPGSPLPGTPLGGGIPGTGSPTVLALVPLGLTPVAVFPPFETPRTVPAEAVIFSEVPQVENSPVIFGRKKRSILDWFNFSLKRRQDYGSRKSTFFDKVKDMYHYLKYKFRMLERNAMCLRTRLYAATHKREIEELRRMSRQFPPVYRSYDEAVDSIDDCIEGIEEPLYGFVINVTVADESPCTLGETCRNFPEDNEQPLLFDFSAQARQTGERFAANGPPTCRVRFNPGAPGCN